MSRLFSSIFIGWVSLALCVAACDGGSSPDEPLTPDITFDSGGDACSDSASCDDENPCTQDLCGADGECQFIPLVGQACDDGSLCTTDDQCTAEGTCAGTGNLACDDENECTVDGCDPSDGCTHDAVEDGAACEDGNLCTEGEACAAGECAGGTQMECEDGNPDDCLEHVCNPANGLCDDPIARPEGAGCDDENPCTVDDTCSDDGICLGGGDYPCTVNHPCQTAVCVPDGGGDNPCQKLWKAVNTGCDDGDLCTTGDICVLKEPGSQEMLCAGDNLDCDDGNECTSDSCDKAAGCKYEVLSDGTPCQKSDEPCTTPGTCLDGVCTGAVGNPCVDDDPCTDDLCDPETGACSHPFNTATCDDEDPCTTDDTCDQGTCMGAPVDCSGVVDPCLQQLCNPSTGQCDLVAEDGTPCLDEDLCNGAESCLAGVCVDGAPVQCADDDNPCTEDICDSLTGQCGVSLENGAPCGDGDPCNGGEVCQDGACLVGEPVVCGDDGDPCTDDVCDSETGQCGVPAAGGTLCEDGAPCTVNDTCLDGVCQEGVQLQCDDDDNPCTEDTCDPQTGECGVPVQNGAPCGDGDPCNGGEACQDGVCISSGPVECQDDGDPCTVDTCDPATGLCGVPAENGTPCEDGDLCTTGDTCHEGSCQQGSAKQCDDDSNPCTEDVCNSATGQCGAPLGDGTTCDDANVCTVFDECTGGICSGELDPCDDENPCTDTDCDALIGCLFSVFQDGTPCGDAGWFCLDGECAWVCESDCTDKDCGDDGCGGSCGVCDDGDDCSVDWCEDGSCQSGPDPEVCVTYYYDGDGDEFGLEDDFLCLCEPTGNYTALEGGDCEDEEGTIYPGASICGVDADCDGAFVDTGEACDDGNDTAWDGCDECEATEFLVNDTTAHAEWTPRVVALQDGAAVVVWEGGGGSGLPTNVYGKVYEVDGTVRCPEFQVNEVAEGSQRRPSVEDLGDGVFVVAWGSDHDTDEVSPYFRRFSYECQALGDSVNVSISTYNTQSVQAVSLAAGTFAAIWDDGPILYSQRYTIDGEPLGAGTPIVLHPETENLQDVHGLGVSDGDLVVAWNHSVEGQVAVELTILEAGSEGPGGIVAVSETLMGGRSIRLSPTLGGGFAVIWATTVGTPKKYVGQFFDENYQKSGSNVLLGELGHSPNGYVGQVVGDDRILSAWYRYPPSCGSTCKHVFAELVTFDGTLIVDEVQLDQHPPGSGATSLDFASLNGGKTLFVWDSHVFGPDGNMGTVGSVFDEQLTRIWF